MTPERYVECLYHLRCTRTAMPLYLGINPRGGRRYADGSREIPPELAEWLERLVASPDWHHTLTEYPFPDGWRATDEAVWEEADGPP
jgi:hypothetical protein